MAISQIPCSDCSYFFPTVRAQHLAGQALAHLSLFQMAISQIPALTAHISYLLWELKIWQTRSWQIYPPSKEQFHIFLPYSESSYLADQVLGNLPHFKWQFYRFLLWLLIFLSYSESSTFGRPGHGTSTPLSNGNFTDSCSDCSYFFPTLRAQHLADQVLADLPPFKWHFHRFLFYSESSTFGRPGLVTSTPLQMAISQIPVLLLEFIFGRPTVGKSTPFKWQFNRFLLWLLIFLSYSESSTFGRPSVGRSIPLSNSYFTDSCSDCLYFFPTLRAHI